MRIDEFDVRDGGRWRYVHREPDGDASTASTGVFHGTPSPDPMVQTFEFEARPGHVSLDTLELEELGDGRTLIRTHSVYQSRRGPRRDGRQRHGATAWTRAIERLDELARRASWPAA